MITSVFVNIRRPQDAINSPVLIDLVAIPEPNSDGLVNSNGNFFWICPDELAWILEAQRYLKSRLT